MLKGVCVAHQAFVQLNSFEHALLSAGTQVMLCDVYALGRAQWYSLPPGGGAVVDLAWFPNLVDLLIHSSRAYVVSWSQHFGVKTTCPRNRIGELIREMMEQKTVSCTNLAC